MGVKKGEKQNPRPWRDEIRSKVGNGRYEWTVTHDQLLDAMHSVRHWLDTASLDHEDREVLGNCGRLLEWIQSRHQYHPLIAIVSRNQRVDMWQRLFEKHNLSLDWLKDSRYFVRLNYEDGVDESKYKFTQPRDNTIADMEDFF